MKIAARNDAFKLNGGNDIMTRSPFKKSNVFAPEASRVEDTVNSHSNIGIMDKIKMFENTQNTENNGDKETKLFGGFKRRKTVCNFASKSDKISATDDKVGIVRNDPTELYSRKNLKSIPKPDSSNMEESTQKLDTLNAVEILKSPHSVQQATNSRVTSNLKPKNLINDKIDGYPSQRSNFNNRSVNVSQRPASCQTKGNNNVVTMLEDSKKNPEFLEISQKLKRVNRSDDPSRINKATNSNSEQFKKASCQPALSISNTSQQPLSAVKSFFEKINHPKIHKSDRINDCLDVADPKEPTETLIRVEEDDAMDLNDIPLTESILNVPVRPKPLNRRQKRTKNGLTSKLTSHDDSKTIDSGSAPASPKNDKSNNMKLIVDKPIVQSLVTIRIDDNNTHLPSSQGELTMTNEIPTSEQVGCDSEVVKHERSTLSQQNYKMELALTNLTTDNNAIEAASTGVVDNRKEEALKRKRVIKKDTRRSMSGVILAPEAVNALAAMEDLRAVTLRKSGTHSSLDRSREPVNGTRTAFDHIKISSKPNSKSSDVGPQELATLRCNDVNMACRSDYSYYDKHLILIKGRRQIQCHLISPFTFEESVDEPNKHNFLRNSDLCRIIQKSWAQIILEDDTSSLGNGFGVSLNLFHDDSYVLVDYDHKNHGSRAKVYVLLGNTSNVIERSKAMEIANSIILNKENTLGTFWTDTGECQSTPAVKEDPLDPKQLISLLKPVGNMAIPNLKRSVDNVGSLVVIQNSTNFVGEKRNFQEFFEILLTTGQSKRIKLEASVVESLYEGIGDVNPETDSEYENKMIDNTIVYSGMVKSDDLSGQPLKSNMLLPANIYIFQFHNETFTWFGRDSDLAERKDVWSFAKELWVSKFLCPKVSSFWQRNIQKVYHNAETTLFKAKFVVWMENNPIAQSGECKDGSNGITSLNGKLADQNIEETLDVIKEDPNETPEARLAKSNFRNQNGMCKTDVKSKNSKNQIFDVESGKESEIQFELENTLLTRFYFRDEPFPEHVSVDESFLIDPIKNYKISIEGKQVWKIVPINNDPTSPEEKTKVTDKTDTFQEPTATSPSKKYGLSQREDHECHIFHSNEAYIVKVSYCICSLPSPKAQAASRIAFFETQAMTPQTPDSSGKKGVNDSRTETTPGLFHKLKLTTDDESPMPSPSLSSSHLNESSPKTCNNKTNRIIKKRDRHVYFFWQGSRCSINDKGASALLTTFVNRDNCPQVRVIEGKEMPFFFRVFNGKLRILENNVTETRNNINTRYYILRNCYPGETCLKQIHLPPPDILPNQNPFQRLRCKTCYILENTKKSTPTAEQEILELTGWQGCQARDYVVKSCDTILRHLEIEYAQRDMKCLTKIVKDDKQHAGKNSTLTDHETPGHGTKVYLLNRIHGEFKAIRLQCPYDSDVMPQPYPFEQSELYVPPPPSLFIVDQGSHLWLWQRFGNLTDNSQDINTTESPIGNAENRFMLEREEALGIAYDYAQAHKKSAVFAVRSGKEPEEFKLIFPTWTETIEDFPISQESEVQAAMPDILDIYEYFEGGQGCREVNYNLEDLQNKPVNLDKLSLEMYLTPEEFVKTFNMSQAEFQRLPEWKRCQLKQSVGLY